MSTENNDGVVVPKEVPKEEEKVVSVKAYEDVSKDMHKYKKEREELKAALNEVQTQLKIQEESKMQEQEQWKELYEKTKAEREDERQNLMQQKDRFMKSQKVAALKQELGGNVKDEYLGFADLDNVVIKEDGSIDTESLHNVANQYRKEHGQLIAKSDNTSITGHAASNFNNLKPKSVAEMSHEETVAALEEIYSNKQ